MHRNFHHRNDIGGAQREKWAIALLDNCNAGVFSIDCYVAAGYYAWRGDKRAFFFMPYLLSRLNAPGEKVALETTELIGV